MKSSLVVTNKVKTRRSRWKKNKCKIVHAPQYQYGRVQRKVTGVVVRASLKRLLNSDMEPGQDPNDHFTEKLLRSKMAEPVSDRRSKDIRVQGFTAECKRIKLMMYRDPTFNIDYMQSTLRHLYLDDLFRNEGAKGVIVGRGIAMTAEKSTCHNCGKQRYYARNCYLVQGQGGQH